MTENNVYTSIFVYFLQWSEDTFNDLFRLSKNSAKVIILKIKSEIMKEEFCHLLNLTKKVLITLRYYATGSLMDTSRMFDISQTEAKLIVNFVSYNIATLSKHFINFPTNQYILSKVKKDFFEIARFPMVVGAIDCTHVKIHSPGGDIPEIYRNSEDFFSINVQIVCDANLRIQNIETQGPCSLQNSRIFKNSKIQRMFERGKIRNGVLVGDTIFPQKNYLMTPMKENNTFINSSTSITSRDIRKYNTNLFCTLDIARTTRDAWKSRFPILATGIDVIEIPSVRNIITATAILHNIARQNRDVIPKVSNETKLLIEITIISNQHDHNSNRNEVNNKRIRLVQYFKHHPQEY